MPASPDFPPPPSAAPRRAGLVLLFSVVAAVALVAIPFGRSALPLALRLPGISLAYAFAPGPVGHVVALAGGALSPRVVARRRWWSRSWNGLSLAPRAARSDGADEHLLEDFVPLLSRANALRLATWVKDAISCWASSGRLGQVAYPVRKLRNSPRVDGHAGAFPSPPPTDSLYTVWWEDRSSTAGASGSIWRESTIRILMAGRG